MCMGIFINTSLCEKGKAKPDGVWCLHLHPASSVFWWTIQPSSWWVCSILLLYTFIILIHFDEGRSFIVLDHSSKGANMKFSSIKLTTAVNRAVLDGIDRDEASLFWPVLSPIHSLIHRTVPTNPFELVDAVHVTHMYGAWCDERCWHQPGRIAMTERPKSIGPSSFFRWSWSSNLETLRLWGVFSNFSLCELPPVTPAFFRWYRCSDLETLLLSSVSSDFSISGPGWDADCGGWRKRMSSGCRNWTGRVWQRWVIILIS